MSAAVRSTPSLSIPQSQNTAPVLEFSCLYTHDIRRKQKRWQDGFLRYHTFNKRVMVYDMPRNFLGDMHWTQGADLQEGDEMTLEKTGIVVQVAEEVGRTETDLSELLQRKDKPSPSKHPASPRVPMPRTMIAKSHISVTPVQAKHKSLNSLLGPSRGTTGKAALPAKSPFEERNGTGGVQEKDSGRESKRQKTESWNVTRTTKTPKALKAAAAASSRSKSGIVSKRTTKQTEPTQRRLKLTEVIDLSSDDEQAPDAESGRCTAQPPSTASPAHLLDISAEKDNPELRDERVEITSRPVQSAAPASSITAVESPSVRQLQRKQISPATENLQSKRAKRLTPPPLTQTPFEVGVCQANLSTLRSSNSAIEHIDEPSTDQSVTMKIDSQTQGRALKLAGSAPRKMLVFQKQVSRVPAQRTVGVVEKETSLKKHRVATKNRGAPDQGDVLPEELESGLEAHGPRLSIHRQRLEERLARISKRQRSGTNSEKVSDETMLPVDARENDSTNTSISAVHMSRQREDSTSSIEELGPRQAVGQGQRKRTSASSFLHPGARETRTAEPNQHKTASRATIGPPKTSLLAPAFAPAPGATESMPPPPPPPPPQTRRNGRQTPVYNKQPQGAAAVMLSRDFKPPSIRPVLTTTLGAIAVPPGATTVATDKEESDPDSGPWSKEAFDLMDWRPPNRDADGRLITSKISDRS